MSDKTKGLLKIKIENGIVSNAEISVDGVALECVTKIVIHPITVETGLVSATLTFEKVLLDLACPEVKVIVKEWAAKSYPAKFTKEPEGGYTVTFRDVSEAISYGKTIEEARLMAEDALLTAMEFYSEDNVAFPTPSELQDGEELVTLK